MREAVCPECGYPLSVGLIKDEETGNIVINLFCEGPAEDEYMLKIDTHLCNEELSDWDIVGSTLKATMKLIDRKSDPFYKLDRTTMKLVERDPDI